MSDIREHRIVRQPKNPSGRCSCRCGREAPRSPVTRRGYRRGEHLRFIKGHSSRKLGPDYRVNGDGCWVWQKSIGSYGYGIVWDGETRSHTGAHRISWEQANGPIPERHEIHHLCGVPACVNPEHLECVTRRQHMVRDERLPFGNPYARVKEEALA